MYTLARMVKLAAGIAIALIVAGIAIHLLGANTSNGIVSAVNDAAKWLVQPFHNVFTLHSAKAQVAVNWGLAAVVYAIVAAVIVSMLARAGVGIGRYGRRPRPVV
jgi:uncharacterized iron-regulated membrane protein